MISKELIEKRFSESNYDTNYSTNYSTNLIDKSINDSEIKSEQKDSISHTSIKISPKILKLIKTLLLKFFWLF